MNGSPNKGFIRENILNPNYHPVKYVDSIFPVYNKKKGGSLNTPSILSTEDLMKWSNEKWINLGVGDMFYPNYVPFMMYQFERNLYL